MEKYSVLLVVGSWHKRSINLWSTCTLVCLVCQLLILFEEKELRDQMLTRRQGYLLPSCLPRGRPFLSVDSLLPSWMVVRQIETLSQGTKPNNDVFGTQCRLMTGTILAEEVGSTFDFKELDLESAKRAKAPRVDWTDIKEQSKFFKRIAQQLNVNQVWDNLHSNKFHLEALS